MRNEDNDKNKYSEEIENLDLENDSLPKDALTKIVELLPEKIDIMPLSQRPVFPGMMIPLVINGQDLIKTINRVYKKEHKLIGAVLAKKIDVRNHKNSTLYEIGCIAKILKVAPMLDDDFQILIQVIRRFKKVKEMDVRNGIRWQVEYFDENKNPGESMKAYTMAIISSVKDLIKLNPLFQEQLKILMSQLSYDSPSRIIDLVTSLTTAEASKLQNVLEIVPLIPRAESLLAILKEEIELSKLQEKIQNNIDEKISKQQKTFFLQEQLKEIKKELGLEVDDKTVEIDKYKQRLKKLTLSKEAEEVLERELNKLSILEPSSAEYNVSRNYIDWLTLLPWGIYTQDSLEITKAKKILDKDHYGLENIKTRILEFIATASKMGEVGGNILCFVGPPGVGKTSIGKSIAKTLGREFYRFSVGGMRDEAEIKGHRRTYIGAMPGKFLQCLKTVKSSNPVIMIDEIDKIGKSFQGDPASALLEVLDPEQNIEFLDHYLDIRFDLSKVLFITTANQLDSIPAALLDRMEVMKLSGYITKEKIEIANRFLIPRNLKEHGLKTRSIKFERAALKSIIDGYAREAGVRNLENKIKKIIRAVILKEATEKLETKNITISEVENFLGKAVFSTEELYNKNISGSCLGLAWTSMGGATLYIEAISIVSSKGGFTLTGSLGDVMKESANIAYSVLRARADFFKLENKFFENHSIHLHVPAGATPKDGPSAGITMAMALYSLVSKRIIPSAFAMTGELSLTGKVLPVGGIKEKIIAAKRVGIKKIILPIDNKKDYEELPKHIKSGLKFYFADIFEDVLSFVFPKR